MKRASTIPAGDLDRIFEPFVNSRRASGGTGLGLPIIRSLRQAYHSTIALHVWPQRRDLPAHAAGMDAAPAWKALIVRGGSTALSGLLIVATIAAGLTIRLAPLGLQNVLIKYGGRCCGR